MSLQETLHRGADALLRLPIVRQIAAREAARDFRSNRDRNMFLGVYPTWEAARLAARECGTEGYDNADSANLYLHRTRLDQHDYPALYWLTRSLLEGSRSVFDIGGSTGIKFLAFRDALAGWPDLRWTVQDVAAMVRRGRELSLERGDSAQLQFTEDLADGDGKDVLFASGVLQYLPQSLGEILQKYRQLPRRIVINTTAIHPRFDYFTVNSIGTAFCPYRVQTQAALIRPLSSLGYRLKDTWINPDKPLLIPFRPDHSLLHYSGFVLDKLP
jgi:putative methyltransferase (TIGR04325 family)